MPRRLPQPQGDLAELAQLVAVINGMQGPQLEQQRISQQGEDARLHLALQALGLTQQQESEAARQALAQQELTQKGGFHTEEMALKERGLQNDTDLQLMHELGQQPSADPNVSSGIGKRLSPNYRDSFGEAHTNTVNRIAGGLRPGYDAARKKDPRMAETLLTGQDPDVVNMLRGADGQSAAAPTAESAPDLTSLMSAVQGTQPKPIDPHHLAKMENQRQQALAQLTWLHQVAPDHIFQRALEMSPASEEYMKMKGMIPDGDLLPLRQSKPVNY